MSLIHPLSAPAAPECLELFKLPDTQTAVLKRYQVEVAPVSSQPAGPLEFHIRTDSPEYCDLSEVKLYGRVRIVNENGSALIDTDVAYLVNLYAQTMFKQVDVKIGNQIISLPQQMYGYKVIIKNILMKSDASKTTQLDAQGYYKPPLGHMDTIKDDEAPLINKRSMLFSFSKWVDFEVLLDEECLKTGRYLLNNVDLSFKFTLAPYNQVIMAEAESKNYKFEISDAKLKIPMITVSPGVILGHANALKSGNALYPYTRVEMMNHSIAQGESNINIYNISRKTVPSRLVFGIVSADAFNGNYKKNPFNFKPYSITSVSVVVNDMVANGSPLDVNFNERSAGGRKYVVAYNQMFDVTGTLGRDFGNGININDFKNGYTLFCYNLEPFTNPGKYFNLMRTGFVRMNIQLSKPLEETCVLIIYTEHQDMYQIDAARNVIVN